MGFKLLYHVLHIFILLNTRLKISAASPSKLILRANSRQNGVCLGHSVGEFVNNPEDCRLFYLCMENGQAVMAACPPTMLFNPDSKLCDTADNVRCVVNDGNNNNNSNNNAQNNQNSNNNSNNNNGNGSNANEQLDASRYCATLSTEQNRITFIGSGTNCHQYFICYYGQAVLQECSANLHWNANIAKCDLPGNAGCSLLNGDGGGNPDVGGSSNSNGGSNTNGGTANIGGGTGELINCPTYGQHIFPHMSRCDYFIYCVKGHAVLQQCPFYYDFDIVSRNCKWRTAAICVKDLNIGFRKLIA